MLMMIIRSVGPKLLKKYDFPFEGTDIRIRGWYERIEHEARRFHISPITFYIIKKAAADYCEKLFPIKCPPEGEFIAYKKALVVDKNDKIQSMAAITLRIPKDARRTSGFFSDDGKCRCDKAFVEKIQVFRDSKKYGNNITEAVSDYDHRFRYTLGKTVKVRNYDGDRFEVCSRGIHFFTKEEDMKSYYF